MAIKGLPGYTWIYPGKKNDFGLTVSTRTAYNPLTGNKLTVREAQTLQHGGKSFEQRKKSVNEVPSINKKERHFHTSQDIKRYADTPDKELNKYQKQLKKEYLKPRSVDDLVKLTGLTKSQVVKQLDNAKIDLTSVRYLRGEGITAKTHNGTKKSLVSLQMKGGKVRYGFYTPRSLQSLMDNLGDEELYPGFEGNITIAFAKGEIIYEGAA